MENVVPDNKNIHSYSEIWRALPPIRTRTGRQKLPSFFFHIMEDTAADNSIRTRGVQAPRDPYRQPAAWYASWPRTPGQSSVSSRHDLMTSESCQVRSVFSPGRRSTCTLLLSRCCFCHFDSTTVIIMKGTAPDNYTHISF